ncbi:MAG TPA: sugar phosphate isomerase/epimerase family protein [Humisphaera sp.]|jgi:D-psicose/D-tagatose/L-ribulose 3-epimerase|nr:sugar phosphate isomerase/epimerase family protein [Humisphaera sp.]
MSIHLGVNAWVWQSPFTTAEHLGLIDKAAKMGFETFEIGLEDPSHVDPIKFKERLKANNMRVVVCGAFGPSRDLTHEDPKYRQESLDYIKAACEICQKSGSPILAGPMYSAVGKRRHVSPEQKKVEWDLAVSGIKKASKIAADHGVKLAIEPLNRFETDLINCSEQCERLINDIGESNVGFHLDTFHMNIEEKNSADAIKRAGKRLLHFHACENDRGAPGSGVNIDWDGVAKALKEVNYQGDAVIESFTPACKAIAAAAAIWREFAPSQDRLASDGLAYLKKILK